ncbi:MAG: rhomboid family intramembrane serine protease [Syntrophobacteraceae bacterium]|nr:rhomboid family intramembrane serine protease [Syntrophobacteraceae bacterium]
MIPLRDVNPSRGTPLVNYVLIALCALAFFYELALGKGLERFLFEFGLVPAKITMPEMSAHFSIRERLAPLLTSMFLHGGWLHLIGNMWTLYIFGDNVEGELGHLRYGIFYVLTGLIAALIHVATNFDSRIPTIGASGAVAGVMGAYFLLYPRARILTLVPIFFFVTLLEIPAYVFLGFWFMLQFFSGTFSLLAGSHNVGGIAWWAHVGGFVGGLVMLIPMKRSRGREREAFHHLR